MRAVGTVSPQTKIAIGEVALWLLRLKMPPAAAMLSLRQAAEDLLNNQYENALTHPLDKPKIIMSNNAA